VSALDQHPVDSLLASFSHDGTWALLDIPRLSVLRQIPTSQDSVLCGRIHVDGLLLGAGQASGVISIWDFREKTVVTGLSGNAQGVTSLDFSENGYHLAAGDGSGEIKLWDLRKMASRAPLHSVKRKFIYRLHLSTTNITPLTSLTLSRSTVGPHAITKVAFDHSGNYIAAGGGAEAGTISLRTAKDFANDIVNLSAHSKTVTGLAWGADARGLWSCSLDKAVKYHA
jgi:WD40 repeat protein